MAFIQIREVEFSVIWKKNQLQVTATAMGKGKELSKDVRKKIIEHYHEGKGYKLISKDMKIPISTVRTTIAKWKCTGSVKSKARPGRPKKISLKAARKLVREAKKNPKVTSTDFQSTLKDAGVEVSTPTIRRVLNRNGLHGRVARKKPYLKTQHKKARLAYAREHLEKSEDFWNDVVWFR